MADAATQGARPIGQPAEQVSSRRDAWRRAAQTVARTWSEWSAADGGRRSELYGRYMSALDAEERAAATLERALSDAAETEGSRDCVASATPEGDLETSP